jgi:LacI family transcriptional regulator
MIREGRRATIRDVARAAGVSTRSVARVVRGLGEVRPALREHVRAVVKELGYVPDPLAQGLALGRASLVGFAYDNPNPDHVMEVQLGLLDGLRGSGLELVVHACDRAAPGFLGELAGFARRLRLAAMVLSAPLSEHPQLPAGLAAAGCVCIRMTACELPGPGPLIVGGDREGARAAAAHLAALGHRRIGFVAGPPDFASAGERRAGFAAGLGAIGLALDPALVAPGLYTFDSGAAAAETLLGLDAPPSAIFACNDEMAAGVLHAAHRRSVRVPEDLSVVGFDDLALARMTDPPLTTVRLPTRRLAAQAAARVLQALRPSGALAPAAAEGPELIVRESTGPA